MTEKETQRLVDRIRRFMEQEDTSETERVKIALDMGEAVRKLRKATPDKWYEFLEGIEMSKKVANRMKRIGEWVYAHDEVIRGLVDKLPADKLKLESLVRLNTDAKITGVVNGNNLRAMDRGEVAKAVATVVGTPKSPINLDDKLRRLGKSAISGLETAIRKLDLGSISAEEREDVAAQIEESFQKCLDFLRDPKVEAEKEIVPFSNVTDDESEDDDDEPGASASGAAAAKSTSAAKPIAETAPAKPASSKKGRSAAG